MSDYEDYSDGDFDLDWFYVEEGSHVADDLAEHAIASPPPTQADEDAWDNWERFDYWYDIDSASDGADDENGERRATNEALKQRGKRKRKGATAKATKKQKLSPGQEPFPQRAASPTPTVLFISQNERYRKLSARMLDENQEPFALQVQSDSPRYLDQENRSRQLWKADKIREERSDPLTPVAEGEENGVEAALMAALQNRLGGSGEAQGLDPSLLLQYAMRMMTQSEDSGDIAGELADDMLNRSEDDPLATGLGSWLSEQGVQIPDDNQDEEWEDDDDNVEADGIAGNAFPPLETPVMASANRLPPTPSSIETNTSTPKKYSKKPTKTTRIVEADTSSKAMEVEGVSTTGKENIESQSGARKRKAAESDAEESTSTAKQAKRVAGRYDAPTAASRGRATTSNSALARRSGRSGRR